MLQSGKHINRCRARAPSFSELEPAPRLAECGGRLEEGRLTDSGLVLGEVSRSQVAAVVHLVVKDAHDQNASLVGLEEDAVPAASGHD